MILGVVLAAVMALTGGAAFLVVSGSPDDDAPSPARSSTSDTGQPSSSATPEPTRDPTPEPEPARVRDARVARRLQSIVEFSLEGRQAVTDGRYQDAIDNRREILRRLDRLRGATGELAAARRTLRRAMQASLDSDIAYASGADATATDAEATRLKRRYVEQWRPIAAEQDLPVYSEGDF